MHFWQRTLPSLLEEGLLRPRHKSGGYGQSPSMIVLPNQVRPTTHHLPCIAQH